MASRQSSRPQNQRARRPRAARACDLCRAKKNKCDESYPCSFCKSRRVQCVYEGQQPGFRTHTTEYVKELEDEIKRLTARVNEAAEHPHTAHKESTADCDMPQIGATPIHMDLPPQDQEEDISGVNQHTRDTEFYGSSSSVAMLSRIHYTGRVDEDGGCLVSSLHNAAFRSSSTPADRQIRDWNDEYLELHRTSRFRGFLEGFFSSIHFIHPILDKQDFLERCETLWSTSADHSLQPPGSSFVALYFSVLALGAIVGVREEEAIDGLSHLQWSRKFFDIARMRLDKIGLVTDLEIVQCYFFMAKVCQNELNPHWSYMYVGLAIRTALAIGINRDPGSHTKKPTALLRAETRTWWGLYSLETEVSFSLGRPDTLGADIYHNRRLPLVQASTEMNETDSSPLSEPPHCAIIDCMVRLSRITRLICQKIYLQTVALTDMMALICQIEKDLNGWIGSLPEMIRPPISPLQQRSSLKGAKDPQWAKRQRLVLNVRYQNLRILLFGSLLLRSSYAERLAVPGCQQIASKCLDSAKHTISIIYQTYEHNDFFRTWFYNTTYTVFAASVILLYVSQAGTNDQEESLAFLQSVDMAVEILEIMDECVVALEAAKLLRRARDRAGSRLSAGRTMDVDESANGLSPSNVPYDEHQTLQLNNYWGTLGLIDGNDTEFDLAFQLGIFGQDEAFQLGNFEQDESAFPS